DTVNVAARLQAAAPTGGVLLADQTALAVADAVELERLPPVELKGKSAAVPVARAVAVRAERSREHAMGTLRAPMLGRDAELAQLRDAQGRGRARAAEHMVPVRPAGT